MVYQSEGWFVLLALALAVLGFYATRLGDGGERRSDASYPLCYSGKCKIQADTLAHL